MTKICLQLGCETEARLRGYCRSCFEKLYRQGKLQKTTATEQPKKDNFLTDAEYQRFVSKINIRGLDDCWNWTAATWGQSKYIPQGYGALKIRRIRQTPLRSNRVALCVWKNGDINDTRDACHTCDNTLCCNPNHLFWGTRKENMRDCVSKGRSAYGEKNGTSALKEDQVLQIKKMSLDNPEWSAARIKQKLDLSVSYATVYAVMTGKNWDYLK